MLAAGEPPAGGIHGLPEGAFSQLRLIVDNLPILIAQCDAHGRYLFVNRAYASRFGLAPEDVVGLTIEKVIGRAAYDAVRPYIDRVLAGERVTFEIDVPYEDLGSRTMRCEYVPSDAGPGRGIESFVASILDVTDQRRAENALRERESHFRAAFELSAVGQAFIGSDRRFLLVNDRYCEMTGYSRSELMQLRPDDFTHADDLARDLQHADALGRGDVKGVTVEKRYVRKGGDVIWVRIHATLFRDRTGAPIGAFSMIEDISREKMASQEREVLFAREHAARLDAEEANRTKDEFLATLSHELRTPLNAILGWTQMLQRKAVAADRVDAALEALDRNARKQAQLVDDLLELSRIAAGRLKLNLERVRLAMVLDAAIDTIQPAIDAKRIAFTLDAAAAPVSIEADPIKLQQVCWNLLSNAVKFTPEGGEIHVSVRLTAEQVYIMVRDTGIGIDPVFVPRLFSRFEQADRSTTRAFEGLGLGLAIVRHLVELHGGTVKAESAGKGLGATFTVALPTLRRGARTGPDDPA
ncbi:MAG TPA: PAS domain S-box protein [Vicinamibacterales bacterium]|nr:PAS domain S-box protein [Vicinamibacterales bacterium]